MEILSNFISIYCYIAFVIGAVLMLVALSIAAMGKDNDELRNNVRFFVTKGHDICENSLSLWINAPKWDNIYGWIPSSIYTHYLCNGDRFKEFYLNPNDFADMKEGEIREVFINLED